MATRKDKLKNVAFGGEWSEQLYDQGTSKDAMRVLARAVEECPNQDVRSAELDAALSYICATLDKGEALKQAFCRALTITEQERRQEEATKAYVKIRLWLGI